MINPLIEIEPILFHSSDPLIYQLSLSQSYPLFFENFLYIDFTLLIQGNFQFILFSFLFFRFEKLFLSIQEKR